MPIGGAPSCAVAPGAPCRFVVDHGDHQHISYAGCAGEQAACVLVTHYQRLLNYITPDYVHVMSAGRIIKSGDKALALELESRGYDWLLDAKKAAA